MATQKLLVEVHGDREIVCTREFEAPRERVWRAFVDPRLLARWWGRGNPLDVERLELARGGHWRFVEHCLDGDQGYEGRFREVVPPERLVQTFDWDGYPGHVSIETTVFEIDGIWRTRVVASSLFHTGQERDETLSDDLEEGRTLSYAALDRVLANM